jgi:hypothetical protein
MAAGAVAGAAGKSGFLSGLGGLGGALSIGSSLIGLLGGIGQRAKAKKMLAGLKDPGYVIPEEFNKNLGIAENMARTGLPSEQYNLASTNIQRGTQAGLRQLGRMSNPFAGIAGLARSQSDAFSQLDASNAAARRQNILGAMGARRELAGQKLNQQQYNQRRYEEAVNEANAMMGAGQQNTASGLGSLGQFGMYQSLYGNQSAPRTRTLGTSTPTTPTTTTPTTANTPAFNPSDPFGLGRFQNPYIGMGGIYGSKFGGYGGPVGIGGGYYSPRQTTNP